MVQASPCQRRMVIDDGLQEEAADDEEYLRGHTVHSHPSVHLYHDASGSYLTFDLLRADDAERESENGVCD